MNNKYQISDSEWIIMKIIWSSKSITANEIIEKLANSKEWSPKTIKSMLSRLVSKEVIGYVKEGRSYSYFPLLSSKETIKDETKSFLKKVFDGDFLSLVASFVEDNNFSNDEIEEFKKILDKRE